MTPNPQRTRRSMRLSGAMATSIPACGHHDHSCLTRRGAFAAVGGTAGALALAACSSGSSGSPTDGGGEGGGEPTTMANVADVPVGGALAATTGAGQAVLLTQPTEGEIRAFSSECTHQGCTVEPGEGELSCPCHGSAFDLSTGDAVQGPATDPLPEVEVTVGDDGAITG